MVTSRFNPCWRWGAVGCWEPGWGAAGRNGGQVIPGLKLDPTDLLARYGEDQGERLVSLVGSAADTAPSERAMVERLRLRRKRLRERKR